MSASHAIARLARYRTSPLPAMPVFFASRLVAEARRTRVVEYCAIDAFGAVRLMVTVAWSAELARPERWTPSGPALAAVRLIGQLFDRERVVVAHELEDEVMQPLKQGARPFELIEMREVLGRRDLRVLAPDLDDQIELLRFDLARSNSAYGDALFLRGCWNFADGRLRRSVLAPPARPGLEPLATRPVSPAPVTSMPTPAWTWWLAAILVQVFAWGALRLLPL